VPTVDLRRKIPRWAVPLRSHVRYKGASGGRASGKSHFFAEEAVEAMVCDPNLRFVCIREVQKSLAFSAKALVESKIRAMGVSDCFDVLEHVIRRRGGEGVMIFQGMQDHTADSLKSLEGFQRAWVEEAQSISERSLRLLTPTIRAPGSEIWFSWNPENEDDPVDQFFARGGHNRNHVHVTYEDNPFCPAEMREEAEEDETYDPDIYEHVWLGGYFLGGNGRVYSNFRNKPFPEGSIDESIEDHKGELLIGMDFNVNPMSAVIAVRAVDECLVIDALEMKTSNTEEMAAEIKRRYPGRRIIVCPDPAGTQRKSSAPVGQTDFTILQRAGFQVRAPNAHPPVVDRINNTQQMLFHEGRRRMRVHPRAKALITGMGNLTYKEGTSQQEKGKYDHICDAIGYLLWQEFNVLVNRTARVSTVHM
jgi:phage terminase large subunit